VSNVSACGFCIAGGTPVSPAYVYIIQNRAVANGAGSLLLIGTFEDGGATLTAQVNNNALSDNVKGTLGFGIRVAAIGSAKLAAPNDGHVTLYANGNEISNNRYALIVDAGFPPRNMAPLPATACADETPYKGHVSVQFNDNSVIPGPATLSPALVTTTRAQVWLANSKMVLWQYLHDSTISIFDPSLTLTGPGLSSPFHHDVPETDGYENGVPDGGVCSYDYSREFLGNSVSYNGSNLLGKNF
jgi:hypothetical protein